MAFLQICQLVNVGLDWQMVATTSLLNQMGEKLISEATKQKTDENKATKQKTDEEMWTKIQIQIDENTNANTRKWEHIYKTCIDCLAANFTFLFLVMHQSQVPFNIALFESFLDLSVTKLAAIWFQISDLKVISRFIFLTISFFGQFDQTERLQWR